MKWFRFYSEVLHDSKVQTLSPEMFRSWVNLLCLANEGETRGRLPSLRQIAFALRIKEERATQIVEQLTTCGLIDADDTEGYRPHNWDKRQRNSDDASNRVREHRKRKSSVTSNGHVTLHETTTERDCNPRARSEEIRTEEIREQPPLPPETGGAVAADSASLPEEAIRAVEDARVKHGDLAGELVRREAKVIDRQLGGRFDLFLEALDAASVKRPKLEDRNVFSWCMARARGKLTDPPKRGAEAPLKSSPAEIDAATAASVASKGCEHCDGMGQVTVFQRPDPSRRIPGAVAADCVCPRGRLMRAKRDVEAAKRIPDLADVLAKKSVWQIDPPGASGHSGPDVGEYSGGDC